MLFASCFTPQGRWPHLWDEVPICSSGTQCHKSSWSVLGAPYRRLLRSAGATEDLFVTRELHQEPPPGIPTGLYNQHGLLRTYSLPGSSIRSPPPGIPTGLYNQHGLLRTYSLPGGSIRIPQPASPWASYVSWSPLHREYISEMLQITTDGYHREETTTSIEHPRNLRTDSECSYV